MLNKFLASALALLIAAPLSAQSWVALPFPLEIYPTGYFDNTGAVTVNAANEYNGIVGQVTLAAGTGSKTCSTASGVCKIYWETGAVTWASAGTNISVGIQDVGADGFPDGTFDVKADLTQGTETITAATSMVSAMETGTKTVAQGDIIAVVIRMTVLAGADSVIVASMGRLPATYASQGFPYGVRSTGTPARNLDAAKIVIQFDDGTYGWIKASPDVSFNMGVPANISFNSGSTPDEYAWVFSLPYSCGLGAIGFLLDSVAATDNFEFILYTNPLSSPSIPSNGTITADPDLFTANANGANARLRFPSNTIHRLVADTTYAIAVRPTTVNNFTIFYLLRIANAIAANNAGQPFNNTFGFYARTNQSGAFASVNSDLDLPRVALYCYELVK